ncbi:MAG: BON domain-containing protein [Desulfobacteraceae bacterium]|nr:BON domain-containing protein [Desulfobacteraceae bacterium]
MKRNSYCRGLALVLLPFWAGCAPAVIGGGAAGGYKAATDERTLGSMMDDGAITARVNAAMVNDPEVKARQIDVDTLQGVVTLTGTVESEAVAKRAAEIARATEGVREVRSYLQVGSKTFGQAMDDKVTGARIKSDLISEPGIRSMNIDVDVEKGVVTLTGIVENAAQKDKILKIARGDFGVVKVVDNLRVAH